MEENDLNSGQKISQTDWETTPENARQLIRGLIGQMIRGLVGQIEQLERKYHQLKAQTQTSEFEAAVLVTDLFLRLRRSGFSLGVSEYLAALRAVDGGFADSREALEQTLRILWCPSLDRAC